jgi:Cu/Ag efflux pump CusA
MLHEKQVQQIREDLQQDGVRSEALLDDLLDHLCTGIEEKMALGQGFDTAYEQLWQQMIPDGAREIQVATDFSLTFKRYIIMRKLVFITGFVWAFLTLMGIMFNVLHFPGGYILNQSAALILSLVLIPAFIIYRVRDRNPLGLLEKATYVIGSLTSLLLSSAIGFKFMHWPGANVLLMTSIIALACAFLPLLFVLWYRQDARKK